MTERLLSIALALGLGLGTAVLAGGEEGPQCPLGGDAPCPEKAAGCEKSECTADCKGACDKGTCDGGTCDGADCDKGECGECCGACEKGATVKAPPLSSRVAELVANSEHGCEQSRARLDTFTKSCESDCSTSLMATITDLEAKADKGCRVSGYKLAVMTARLDGKPAPRAPMSVRVAMLKVKADKGCEKSQEILTAIETECGAGCDTNLVQGIAKLEDMAAKGCEQSKARLVALAELMPAAPAKGDGKGACGKEGCDGSGSCGGDCAGDCGGKCAGGEHEHGACPSGKAAPEKGACPESGCPSGRKANA